MKKIIKKALLSAISIVLALPISVLVNYATAEKALAAPGGPSVVLSEFVSHPSTGGQEWVELQNTTETAINLSGWSLTELTSPNANPLEVGLAALSGILPASGLLTVDVGGLNDTGDSIGLYNGAIVPANLVSRISYGNVAAPFNVNVVAAPSQGKSVAVVSGVYLTNQAPTKGWFNASPTISQIVSSLPAGITTNLSTLANPTTATGLYFAKDGYGKITFNSPINLTDQATVSTLQSLSTSLDLESGLIKLAPSTGDTLKTLGASLEMDNLPFPNGVAPTIYVDGQATTPADVDSVVYLDGKLTFNAKHFSTYTVDATRPDFTTLGFTSAQNSNPTIAMTGDRVVGFNLETDREHSTDYKVQFSATTALNTQLKATPAALYLTGLTDAQKLVLDNYYDARVELTGLDNFKTYLKAAVAGANPFAYIYTDVNGKAKLEDAAKKDLVGQISDMTIPGDYPLASYTVAGNLVSASGIINAINFKLIVQTLNSPVALDETDTAKIPAGTKYDYTVTIPASVTDGKVDLSALPQLVPGTTTLNGEVDIKTTTIAGDIDIQIAAGTQISGNGWTGILNAPRIISINPVVQSAQGKSNTGIKTIEVGFGDTKLTFDKAVRMVFTGQAGSQVGYTSGGVFTLINSCPAGFTDDQTSGNTLSAGSDCKLDSGADLVVWTKHFTEFVTYSQSVTVPVISSAVNVQKNGKNYIDIVWSSTGADSYEIRINNVPNVFTGTSAEIQVDTIGQSSIKMRAKVGQDYSDFSNTVVVTVAALQPAVSASGSQATSTPAVSLVAKASAATVAPAAPVVQSTVSTPSDSQGIIKGTDNSSEATETTNWTPWIILFTLIILAGAVTGGYFYWFAGKEETIPPVKSGKIVTEKAKVVVRKKESGKSDKQKPAKKQNRW